ncbi:MAG: DUF2281 domain-containing protein [Gemmatimonadetes bacterium]|nr:DUF2281 domain-containing protein [Gemmatimonadota bacterium]
MTILREQMAEERMNEILKKQLWRKLESLPEEKQYEVLDFVHFLTSEYSERPEPRPAAFQQFAESVQRQLRRTRVSANTMKGTMKVLGRADRVLDSFREAGREFLAELEAGSPEPPPKRDDEPPPEKREIIVE